MYSLYLLNIEVELKFLKRPDFSCKENDKKTESPVGCLVELASTSQ